LWMINLLDTGCEIVVWDQYLSLVVGTLTLLLRPKFDLDSGLTADFYLLLT